MLLYAYTLDDPGGVHKAEKRKLGFKAESDLQKEQHLSIGISINRTLFINLKHSVSTH